VPRQPAPPSPARGAGRHSGLFQGGDTPIYEKMFQNLSMEKEVLLFWKCLLAVDWKAQGRAQEDGSERHIC
jgi:hypothetical protein